MESTVEKVAAFVCDEHSRKLTSEYGAALEKRNVDIGLNPFAIVSDLYYRENFHSDVLRVLLNPNTPHGEGGKYLQLFLRFLKSHNLSLNEADYQSADVTREEGRIDVLIKDDTSMKAIILENKINDAGDTHRQLPSYLQFVTGKGYTCEAIIYLRLHQYGEPDTTDWTKDEVAMVGALRRIVNAYTDDEETGASLFHGWIVKCHKAAENADAKYLFKHYAALIKQLAREAIPKQTMKQFYELMLDVDKFRTAETLSTMLDGLPSYRAANIIDRFTNRSAPFQRIKLYAPNHILFTDRFWRGGKLQIDLVLERDVSRFHFWDAMGQEAAEHRAELLLKEMSSFEAYSPCDLGFDKSPHFKFPAEERALFDYIEAFNNALGDALTRLGE